MFRNREISFGSHVVFEARAGSDLLGSAKNLLTLSTETAKFRPSPSAFPAFTPIKLPDSLINGPPELPGLMESEFEQYPLYVWFDHRIPIGIRGDID